MKIGLAQDLCTKHAPLSQSRQVEVRGNSISNAAFGTHPCLLCKLQALALQALTPPLRQCM